MKELLWRRHNRSFQFGVKYWLAYSLSMAIIIPLQYISTGFVKWSPYYVRLLIESLPPLLPSHRGTQLCRCSSAPHLNMAFPLHCPIMKPRSKKEQQRLTKTLCSSPRPHRLPSYNVHCTRIKLCQLDEQHVLSASCHTEGNIATAYITEAVCPAL